MGNCCPCLYNKTYPEYDYVCDNPSCKKPLHPEQELFIVPNNSHRGEDYIYCSKKCHQNGK